jgi:hypothetical protein
MKGFNRRIYEMLNRILVFAKTHPQYFEEHSRAARLAADIDAAVGKLSEDAISQTSRNSAMRLSSVDRALARDALRDQLLAISRTAKGLGLHQFWMPRDGSDRALVEFGHIFARHAAPLRDRFIESHLPAGFIDDLNKAVQNLEAKIQDQAANKGSRIAATVALEKARTTAVAAVQALDPIMENILRNEPETLAVWQSARRVERTGSRKTAEDLPPSLPTSPLPPQAPTQPTV